MKVAVSDSVVSPSALMLNGLLLSGPCDLTPGIPWFDPSAMVPVISAALVAAIVSCLMKILLKCIVQLLYFVKTILDAGFPSGLRAPCTRGFCYLLFM